MRLITKQKQVNFHGIMVWVPEWTRYVAADSDGDVHSYEKYPYATGEMFLAHRPHEAIIYICTVDLEDLDWRQTLVEVE